MPMDTSGDQNESQMRYQNSYNPLPHSACIWPMEEDPDTSVQLNDLNSSGGEVIIARRIKALHATNRPRATNYHDIAYGADDSIIGETTTTDLTDSGDDRRAKNITMSFDFLDAVFIVFSICSFIFDLVTDIAVAVFHYLNNDWWYFGLTVTFIVLPTFVTTSISLRWYILDSRIDGSEPVTRKQWCVRTIFHLLQVGPILRYLESLNYGIEFRHATNKEEKKRIYLKMINEDADATLLRLFESFMEASPQLILQMYILTKNYPYDADDKWTVIAQLASISTSLISVSWSLVSYCKTLRISLPDKIPMTYGSITVMFLWEFFTIAARVLALALFSSVFVHYVAIVCAIHWSTMFVWIMSMQTNFCNSKLEELGFNAVLGIIFIFCYFNPVDSATRYRYTIFYFIMVIENSILMYFWYQESDPALIYKDMALYLHYTCFVFGIFLMVSNSTNTCLSSKRLASDYNILIVVPINFVR